MGVGKPTPISRSRRPDGGDISFIIVLRGTPNARGAVFFVLFLCSSHRGSKSGGTDEKQKITLSRRAKKDEKKRRKRTRLRRGEEGFRFPGIVKFFFLPLTPPSP